MDVDRVDEDDDIMQSYYSLIEHIEKTKSCLDGNNVRHYPTIKQNLVNCSRQMDFLITLERDHSSFLALCQQKHQLTLLIDIVDQLAAAQHSTLDTNINASTRRQPYRNVQNKDVSKKPAKLPKNDGAEQVISSTALTPKVNGLHEIVGLHDVKKTLKSLTILPKTQPQLFDNRRICNTILLYGPPGTGKTRLTHALAAEAKANFHCVSAGDILSHFVGQTEKIKTEFMCQMSSIEDCKNMIVICATNCPWDLDSAILRRLQKRIYIPLPNHGERLEFFRFLTNNIQIEDKTHDWSGMVQMTDGYSGSDLHDLVQCAITIPLHELEDTKIWKCCVDGFYEPVVEDDFSNIICSELRDLPSNSVRARKVRLSDFLTAADNVKCTIPQNEVRQYEHFNGC